VSLNGGPAVTLASLNAGSRGATWASDDTIIFASQKGTTGLERVPANGGPSEILTRPDPTHGESDHVWPESVPGGHAVLFTITSLTAGLDAAQIAILDLDTGTRKVLLRGGSHARYVAVSGAPVGGYLVYAAARTLWAAPFDLAAKEIRGTPVPIVPNVTTMAFGAIDAVVADDGTLVFVPRGAETLRNLVWVNRQGEETSTITLLRCSTTFHGGADAGFSGPFAGDVARCAYHDGSQ
jgi:hypothetical protein